MMHSGTQSHVPSRSDPIAWRQAAIVIAHLLLLLGIVGCVLSTRRHLLFWYTDGGVLADVLRSEATWLGTSIWPNDRSDPRPV